MKKLGKLLLFGAAVGTAAAAAYHYFQKQEKETACAAPETDEDEAYFDEEDFDDELDITVLQPVEDLDDDFFDDPTPDTDIEDKATTTPSPSFSPLAETLMQEENVEEFFDEDSDDISEE